MLSEKEVRDIKAKWDATKTSFEYPIEVEETFDTCLALFALIEDINASFGYGTPGMRVADIERLLKDWEGKVKA